MKPEAFKAKVIVVDDEPAIASTLAMILNQSGFEAIPITSGEEEVELAEVYRKRTPNPS